MICGCQCYVSLPHGAVGGSMVCNCHSHLLFVQEVNKHRLFGQKPAPSEFYVRWKTLTNDRFILE